MCAQGKRGGDVATGASSVDVEKRAITERSYGWFSIVRELSEVSVQPCVELSSPDG